jgi:hypothetical protein
MLLGGVHWGRAGLDGHSSDTYPHLRLKVVHPYRIANFIHNPKLQEIFSEKI